MRVARVVLLQGGGAKLFALVGGRQEATLTFWTACLGTSQETVVANLPRDSFPRRLVWQAV